MRRQDVVGASSSTPRVPHAHAAPRSASRRALVVEDDPFYAGSIGRRLARDGWAVSYADDGLEARELLTAGAFGLVVLELEIPDLNGWELLRYMRGLWELGVPLASESTLIVATSRDADEEVSSFAQRLGADQVLGKPFTATELATVVIKAGAREAPASGHEEGIEPLA